MSICTVTLDQNLSCNADVGSHAVTYARSVRAAQILSINGIDNAVLETKVVTQNDTRCCLQGLKHSLRGYFAACNTRIAMIAITIGENRIRLNRLPEANVIQWLQPFHHIIDVFKNAHGMSVSKSLQQTQIWEEKTWG